MDCVHHGEGVNDDAVIVAPLAALALVVLLASGQFTQFKTWLQNFVTNSTTSTSPLIISPLDVNGNPQGQGNQTLASTGLTPPLPAGWAGGFAPPAPAPPSATGLFTSPQANSLNPNSWLSPQSNTISVLGGP